MALDDIKNELNSLQEEGQAYLEHTEHYVRLKIFQVLVKLVVGSTHTLIAVSLVSMVLLLFSFGLASHLGELYDNALIGYSMVAGGYVLIGLIIYLFRNSIKRVLIRRLSAIYFDEES